MPIRICPTRARRPTVVAAWLLASCASIAAAQRAGDAMPPDLTGSWNLNAALSETPPPGGLDDATRPGGRFGGGLGGGVPGTTGGRPGDGAMGGAMGDPERARRSRDAMRELIEAPVHLSITRDGNAIVLEAPSGERERLVADGKKYPHALPSGEVTNKAAWKHGILKVESMTRDGMKLERQFALEQVEASGDRLVVTYVANLPMARRPIAIRRVYDRVVTR